MRRPCRDIEVARGALNQYGSLETSIRGIRDARPLDLSAVTWREAHGDGTFHEWRERARQCLRNGLHYAPPEHALNAKTLETTDRGDFILERIEFDTTPWFRVRGFFLLPKTATKPVPGLVVFHAWGGPMIFGKERIVNSGRDHLLLAEHREKVYSGKYLAEEFAKAGYAVVVIDAHHFGDRAPRGVGAIPASYDPFELDINAAVGICAKTTELLFLGVRQLSWAGTTWMGVNAWDDRRCIDYLQSRPEVDFGRIGCTGLSGGGWRTNMLAALDDRIKASVSVGWMTTGDYQQAYNVAGAIGTFCLLPGVWDRLDVPDLTVMAAPCASLVVSAAEDPLFPPEGQQDAFRQIGAGYRWAGVPEKALCLSPAKVHCYDAELQARALDWFEEALGR